MQKPWQSETFTLSAFPRCYSYLKSMGCRQDKYPISDYWAAVILADSFTDKQFQDKGCDFSSSTGAALLGAIEAMFRGGVKKTAQPPSVLSDKGNAQLMAFLGSRGVKTSMLANDDEIWQCALILWPKLKRGGSLGDLVSQIRLFSKAQRKTANANLKKLPEKWKA